MRTDRGTADRLADRTLGLKGPQHLVGDDGVPMDPEQLGEHRVWTLGPHPFSKLDDGNVLG